MIIFINWYSFIDNVIDTGVDIDINSNTIFIIKIICSVWVLEYEFNMNLFLLNNLYYNCSLIFIFNVIDVGVDIDNNTNILLILN